MPDTSGSHYDWPAIQLPLRLSPGLVHVIRVSLDGEPNPCAELTDVLSAEEQQRAARFRFDSPRQQFVICRATLRELLANCCGVEPVAIQFQYGLHGKPELCRAGMRSDTPRIEFSVSHSGKLGLVAMTIDSQVGIDIEEFNPAVRTQKLAERFFAPAEADELSSLPLEKHLSGFYRGWTCKEAYIKATGRGLSLSLSSFRVVIDPDQPAALRHVDGEPEEPCRWTTRSLDVAPGYAGAVMAACSPCDFACWQWSSSIH